VSAEISLPSGTVTFLFTDVEGSTGLWADDAGAMSASLRVHDQILREGIEAAGGYVFTTAGDAFCAAFERASDAVGAARAMQAALAAVSWPGPVLRVRMGVHLGEAEERGGDYFGPVVNTAARIESVGHGGQLLVSDLVRSAAGVDGVDLGEVRLRDVAEPVHLWQVGDGDFGALRTGLARSNLPSPPTSLVGRGGDIVEVQRLMGGNRLVTLSAVGGTGKTRLAIAVANAEFEHWPAGVWFVDLTSISDDSEFCALLASVVGMELGGGDPIEELVDFVAPQPMLIVLDNCEHVVDACADFTEALISRQGNAAVLATSREWLDVDGERTYLLRSLDTDGPDAPAVQLFEQRASAVDASFAVTASNIGAVQEVCNRLDGIPLAIELAAARVTVLPPAELAAGLDDRFRVLTGGRRRQRQRTLETTIDWSYDLLDNTERDAFASLGVFVGSFDLDAAAAVCGVPRAVAVDLAEALLSKSLITGASQGRFRLLETLKAYAEDRLFDLGMATETRDRHLDHFIERAGSPNDLEIDPAADLSLVEDTGNLLAAADWAESQGRWSDLREYLQAIWGSLLLRSDSNEIIARIERCVAHIEDPADAAQLDWLRGVPLILMAEWSAYASLCRTHMELGDPYQASKGYFGLSTIVSRHDPDEATRLINQGTQLRAGSDRDDLGWEAAIRTSVVTLHLGQFDDARQQSLAALDAADALPITPWGEHVAVANLAAAAWALHEPESIFELVPEAEDEHIAYDPARMSQRQFFRALATIATAPANEAAAAVEAYALTAGTDRFALEQNDALVLLAVLAESEGDLVTARTLLMDTGTPRSPATGAVAQECARRVGVSEELDAAYQANVRDRHWAIEQPKQALRAEMQRRGWE